MEKHMSKTFMNFETAATENWFLTHTSNGKSERYEVEFEDGKSFIYKTRNKIQPNDIVVICNKGMTGGEMGKAIGISKKGGGKSFLNPIQFVFEKNPNEDDIKKMASKLADLSNPDVAFKKYASKYLYNDAEADIINDEIENVLFACCVLANENLATSKSLQKAKDYLEHPKAICSELFGLKFNEKCIDPNFIINDLKSGKLKISLQGYYPGWEQEWTELSIKGKLKDKKEPGVIWIEKGSANLEKLIRTATDFSKYYNDLIYRSSLAIIIRGGFVNLLKAAFSVSIPCSDYIDGFRVLAENVGSFKCLEILNTL